MIMSPGDEQRHELLDELVDRRAGLDHQHHLARRLETADQFFEASGSRSIDLPLAGPLMNSSTLLVVRLKTATEKPRLRHVQRQVLAHHGQADQSDVACCAM